jgi:hypothetical protein
LELNHAKQPQAQPITPPGFTLHSLGIQLWNPGFGGRWNAGSNKRGGGTTIEPRDYANRLLAKLIPALMP